MFFHVDINQSEVEDGFQLASDWIKSVQKNVNKSKSGQTFGLLSVKVNNNKFVLFQPRSQGSLNQIWSLIFS